MRAAFFAAYRGPVDAERGAAGRCLASRLTVSALLAGYAAAEGRPALLAEAPAPAGLRRCIG